MTSQAARKIEQDNSFRRESVRADAGNAETLRAFNLAPLTAALPLRNTRKPLRLFIASDIAALIAASMLSWLAALAINENFFGRAGQGFFSIEHLTHLAHFGVIGAGLLLWLNHRGHYRTRLPFWTEIQHIVTGAGFCILLDSFLQFAGKQDLSRLWLVGSWLFAGIMIAALRPAARWWLQRQGVWHIRTLIVGDGPTAQDARAAIDSEKQLGYRVVGQIDDWAEQLADARGSWTRLCNWHGADFVLAALDGEELRHGEDMFANLTREQVPFAISPPLRGVPVLGMEAQCFFNHDVMLLTHCNRLEEALPRFVKRGFDIAVSGAVLLATMPLFVIVALLIRRDGGPVFYSDRRIGAGGAMFGCLKFRSMIVEAEKVLKNTLATHPAAAAEWAHTQKLRNDPRITKIGAFIRKTSIDELPQLLNVLRGEMSLVGPRPMMVSQAGIYGRDVGFYEQVRPGITGLWQISGRNDVSFERRVELDRWYVRNWTLWHDIAILFKTVPVLLLRKGAY